MPQIRATTTAPRARRSRRRSAPGSTEADAGAIADGDAGERREDERGDVSTRQRMIEAAVACIAEEGYYRASSNRIAKRAGVTWGVIQHHFGTRERLLLEVAHDGAHNLLRRLETATIEGATPAERLESLADVVYSHYSRPEFLVESQVVMNLSRDPSTAAETIKTLEDLSERTMSRWQELVDAVVDPSHQQPALGRSLFYVLRGAAVGESLVESLAPRPARERRSHTAERALLLRALASQLDVELLPPADAPAAAPKRRAPRAC